MSRKKIQARIPVMFNRQDATLDESGVILYRKKGLLKKLSLSQIKTLFITEKVFILFQFLPVHVWDLEILDSNNETNSIKNLSRNGKEMLLLLCEKFKTNVEKMPLETNLLFLEIVRDSSTAMPKWITYIVIISVILLLVLTVTII